MDWSKIDWARWVSPEGVLSLIALLSIVGSGLTAIFARIDWRRANRERDEHRDRTDKLASAASAIITGIEDARKTLGPEAAAKLIDSIKAATDKSGVEPVVNAVVKAVTEGKHTVYKALDGDVS